MNIIVLSAAAVLTAAQKEPGEHRLCDKSLLFHQMLAGRDIAAPARAANPAQRRVFEFGHQMKNLIYLVGDPETHECVAVDAAYDPEGVVEAAAEVGCNITAFVATHYHYDHIGARRGSPVQPAAPAQLGELPGLRYFLEDLKLPGYIHRLEVPTTHSNSTVGVFWFV